ncbi:N,N-dimethylformamidase, partial [Aquamicrobium sp. NLF2-7]|nr:N,N-dimethylformamidase [Aquamicrobium sp. NLF2-7]
AGDDEDRIPFFVKPRQGDRRAPICLVASTATYLAYANLNPVPFPIAELLSSRVIVLHKANLLIDEHPEWGPSLYDVHSDGSGVCYSSRLRPILNFRPGYISSFGAKGSNLREFNADTHITDWLESQGLDYDVVTDDDLHAEGFRLLSQYATVVTGSHPEYFSAEMWEATKSYVDAGGRLAVLGGNGFYWRIAYHPVLPGVMEVRRNGPAIRTWETQPGEEFHSFDGKRGGLWRAHGRPPQSIGGVGFISEGFDLSAFYRRTAASEDPRAAFIFDGVDDEIIGDFGLQGGGAAGIEIDHADTSLGTPVHALILASSEGHTEAFRLVNEEMSITVPTVTAPVEARIQADMVFFETAGGGAVFNVGSIAWPGSLSHNNYDNNISRITGNVLRRFVDPTPFVHNWLTAGDNK